MNVLNPSNNSSYQTKKKEKKVLINCLEYDIEEDESGSWNDRSAHEMVT